MLSPPSTLPSHHHILPGNHEDSLPYAFLSKLRYLASLLLLDFTPVPLSISPSHYSLCCLEPSCVLWDSGLVTTPSFTRLLPTVTGNYFKTSPLPKLPTLPSSCTVTPYHLASSITGKMKQSEEPSQMFHHGTPTSAHPQASVPVLGYLSCFSG